MRILSFASDICSFWVVWMYFTTVCCSMRRNNFYENYSTESTWIKKIFADFIACYYYALYPLKLYFISIQNRADTRLINLVDLGNIPFFFTVCIVYNLSHATTSIQTTLYVHSKPNRYQVQYWVILENTFFLNNMCYKSNINPK